MPGDSDHDFSFDEDQEEGDDPIQVTPQELRRLRIAELRRHLPQHFGGEPAQPEEPDVFQGTEGTARFPPPSPPPWPTPLSQDEPEVAISRTQPLSSMGQSGVPRAAPPPPAASSPPPRRKRTDPFLAPRGQDAVAPSLVPQDVSAFTFPGWRGFRRQSHWLIPLLLVTAFFLLVLVGNPHQAGPMLFVFGAIGLLQAALLLYAPNDAFWAVAVVGGFLVLLAIAFFALFSALFGLVLSILLLALGGLAVRERYYPVKEGTVVVMGLFGRFNRTLQPGFNLRAPGEKVLGVVETQKVRYEARLPPMTLFSGEQVTLSVAISYQVVPGQEYLAIRTTKDWQKPIQQQLVSVVQDVISALSIDAFRQLASGQRQAAGPDGITPDLPVEEQATSPLERINARLTAAMREQVADRGVAVHAVKAHIIDGPYLQGGNAASLGHPAQVSHPTVMIPSTQPEAGRVVESAIPGTPQGVPASPPVANAADASAMGASAAPADWPGQVMPPSYSPGSSPAVPPIRVSPPSGGGETPPMTLLSAQALAETYDAVVRQRITDPGTIRRIIAQFEAVAADPELSQQVPFDAVAGARNLQNHLHQLEMRQLSMRSSPPTDKRASPPGAPATSEAAEDD